MATTPPEPQLYRRSQRRRALIGWIGGFIALAALVALIVAGSRGTHHRRDFKVPYGEMITAKDYAGIELGEEDAVVLPRLVESGRPERFVKPYVLALFPPREDGVYCTYFEFSDQLSIFARLCFSESTGYLVEKRKHDVRHPLRSADGGGGQVV